MIDFYTADTPNGFKVLFLLEELKLPYNLHKINFSNAEQKSESFLKLNPNGKIPVIADSETGVVMAESGAILIYLAEKTGKLLSNNPKTRAKTLEWLMFQMSAVGVNLGQLYHFTQFAPEKLPYAIERFEKEATRVLQILDANLADKEYLAGEFSIADIATYPWITAAGTKLNIQISEYKNLQKWVERISDREATSKF